MSNTLRFDLVEVLKVLRQRRRFIIIVTIAAAVLGVVLHFVMPKKYEAKTEFLVRTPMYSDRNYLYNSDSRLIDYFAGEDDLDKIIAMSESDSLQNEVISKLHLASAYKIDTTTPKGILSLKAKFNSNLDIKRTQYREIDLRYTDTDPDRAALVARTCVKVIGRTYQSYYNSMRENMYNAIKDKLQEEDSAINALTDTLAILRDKYGIYDIISPSRYNIMLSGMKNTGKADFGRGVEEVQNVEAIKDQMINDKTRQVTLLSQYSTGMKIDQFPLTQVTLEAVPPVKPKGLGGMLTVLAAGLLGFIVSVLLVLLSNAYRKVSSAIN